MSTHTLTHSTRKWSFEGNREIGENKDDWIKSNFSYILLLLQGFFLNGSISLDSGGHFNGESTYYIKREQR